MAKRKTVKKIKGAWWNTGLHDIPEIKYLKTGEYGGPYIENGPFSTWERAHQDLMVELSSFISDIQLTFTKACNLEKPKNKRNK